MIDFDHGDGSWRHLVNVSLSNFYSTSCLPGTEVTLMELYRRWLWLQIAECVMLLPVFMLFSRVSLYVSSC